VVRREQSFSAPLAGQVVLVDISADSTSIGPSECWFESRQVNDEFSLFNDAL
jgi:hypothetical protein